MASSTSWGFKRFIALTRLMHGSTVTIPFLYQLNALYKLCKRDIYINILLANTPLYRARNTSIDQFETV